MTSDEESNKSKMCADETDISVFKNKQKKKKHRHKIKDLDKKEAKIKQSHPNEKIKGFIDDNSMLDLDNETEKKKKSKKSKKHKRCHEKVDVIENYDKKLKVDQKETDKNCKTKSVQNNIESASIEKKEESIKSKTVAENLQNGQWETVNFDGNEEKKNKFLRLMGGLKSNKKELKPTCIKNVGNAPDKNLNDKLEQQYLQAMNFKLSQKKKQGFGFDDVTEKPKSIQNTHKTFD